MSRVVHVTAPSRLHFGMFSFGREDVPQFGGVGVMIDQPGLRISFRSSEQLEAHGPLSERAVEFARRTRSALELNGATANAGCRIDILSAPPEHVGLGVGTQLGLAVATGLATLLAGAAPNPLLLATIVQRSQRSAVGTHGFAHGGLIVESGKRDPYAIGPMVARVELPNDWRWVLLRPASASQGLSGPVESRAFSRLPPVPSEITAALCQEALLELVPAAQQADFERFSEGLYRFGHLAGSCFAAEQGGPYATPQLASLVEYVRVLGVPGVGQTSWGPTLFALCANADQAQRLVEQLQSRFGASALDMTVAATSNRGAIVL